MDRLYFLMLKIHNVTKLKYLCFHYGTRESCYTYNGSGSYWTAHLSKHGKDITTDIILESLNRDEISIRGIQLSKEWDIVKSDKYANLTIEDAQTTAEPLQRPEVREKRLQSMKDRIQKYGLTEKEKKARAKGIKSLQQADVRERAATTLRNRLASGNLTNKEKLKGLKRKQRIQQQGFTEAELRSFTETSKRQLGKTMKERLNNPNYVPKNKGKSMKEICGYAYNGPWNKNKTMVELKGENFIDPRGKSFKIISHLGEQVFKTERDFITQMNFSAPILTKLKRFGFYKVKRQSNTSHPYRDGETIYLTFL